MSNAELIERLNEPERHYPGNFDTAKRANALLSGLCQEAADAIAAADKRIAELEALLLAEPFRNEREKEAERKLAVAREALRDIGNYASSEAYVAVIDATRTALAQIGEPSAGN